MNIKLVILFAIGFAINSFTQNMTFVMDSVMDSYMKSGYANKHFMPKGKEDANDLRQGIWKDYEVVHDFMYVSIDNKPEQIIGDYLVYGEGKFIDGKRGGEWKMYVLEDKTFKKILQKEVMYVSGELTGIYKYFFPNGKVSQVGNFETDKVTELNIYYDNGKLFRNYFSLSGKYTGKSTTFFSNGKMMVERNYELDSLNGLFQSYYANGNTEQVSFFKMGKPDGIYRYYHENGQLWIEKEYKEGLLMNVLFNYDESGKSRDFGTLKNGNGTIKYYTRTGDVYSVQTFKDGVLVSEEKNADFDR